MTDAVKQHLIDPEICIRCYTCEMTCPVGAIVHDDTNVVVDAQKCNFCMDCIPVCPTGSIDEWRVVQTPYDLETQFSWDELPEQATPPLLNSSETKEKGAEISDPISALLAEAHKGSGGKPVPPASAAKPTTNLYTLAHPIEAVVQGNFRLTEPESDADVRHIILDFQGKPFPVLEGQSLGVLAPGTNAEGRAHLPRLYSVSSPRDGERPGYHNVSLTVKREEHGVCSNYLCDLVPGDTLRVTGPFGSTFLLPEDPKARLLMVCTGTGAAPMRAFTMARQRRFGQKPGGMMMFFGARTPGSLPYFGPLGKIPEALLQKHLVFSRDPGQKREYVQDRMLQMADQIREMLEDENTHIYICGLKDMEQGVNAAFEAIAQNNNMNWEQIRQKMQKNGQYQIETY